MGLFHWFEFCSDYAHEAILGYCHSFGYCRDFNAYDTFERPSAGGKRKKAPFLCD